MEADAVDQPVIVAGSMGPTGEIFEPVGTLTHEQGVAAFAEQAKALEEGGADVLWIETISSEEEFRAAVEGARTTGLPVVATMSFDHQTDGPMMGLTPCRLCSSCIGTESCTGCHWRQLRNRRCGTDRNSAGDDGSRRDRGRGGQGKLRHSGLDGRAYSL